MLKTMQNRDPILETSGKIIGFYEREFYPFSNFSSFQVEWRGRVWMTSEHAYQASKFMGRYPKLVEKVTNARSAHEAFKIAMRNADKKLKNWSKISPKVMLDICRHKLEQNPYVKRKLLQAGDLHLVEDSPKDDFWGWGPNKDGRNELGKVWMKLRKELKEKSK